MFETAMNNPSNPIVNPVNSLNPIEYSQTLFGAPATGMAANTSFCSFNNNQVHATDCNNSGNSRSSNNLVDTKDELLDDATVDAVPTCSNSSNSPNVPNVFNQINSCSNRMMAENATDSRDDASVSTTSYSDFNSAGNMNPSMARTNNNFPKYVPNLNDNNAEPRPVLANFSTFGS